MVEGEFDAAGRGAGQLVSVLVTPTMGTWGLGRRSTGPWPGWPRHVSWTLTRFCRKCLPGADPKPSEPGNSPAFVEISPVISMVGAQGLETLDPLIKS
jgi:hypothetical protein